MTATSEPVSSVPPGSAPASQRGSQGELVVVTGMTGAGRSTAAKELEDLGYFVVDNLPPTLVPDVVGMVEEVHGPEQSIAVVVDVRSGSFFDSLREVLLERVGGRRTTLLFLEADDDVLVRRQEAARRPHPLQAGGRLLDGLARERSVIAELRGQADLVIDTSNLNVHQLTAQIARRFGTEKKLRLQVTVVSFGFKYGIPVDSDYVADMRFLPNPHWVPELRPHTGKEAPVSDYVMSQPGAGPFLDRFVPLLVDVGGGFLREGKRFMTVAMGCTGGKHRSVAMAEEVAAQLRTHGLDAKTAHRDLGRE